MRKLTSVEVTLIASGLRTAAPEYQKAAELFAGQGHDRMAEQFKSQAAKSEALAELFEGYPTVWIDIA